MMKRKRSWYWGLCFLVIVLGLASRTFRDVLPVWVGAYAGDVLWGLMVFLLTGALFSQISIKCNLLISLGFSFAIEFSQLYHAPWLDSLRNTKLGSLILGFGFLWSDLLCYLLGISIGVLLEIILSNKKISK